MRKKTSHCVDCGILIWQGSTRCSKCANTKQNNPNWLGGLDDEKYKIDFNRDIRSRIRFRDRFTCQICGKKEQPGKENRLDVHHIDYNKLNTSSSNLVALCRSCHIDTNSNREKWVLFFKEQFKKRGLYESKD
jgi:5-methylcytosine-specific restriction endonuclease McrA